MSSPGSASSRRTLLILLMTAAILIPGIAFALADGDKPAAPDKDLEQLQGEWHMQSGTIDGTAIPAEMLSSMRRVCKDDQLTVTHGDMLIMKAKITLDSSKTPKTIDYDITDGPNKGKKQL